MTTGKFSTALIIALILASASSSLGATSARIQVTATVPPFVSLDAVQHVRTYQVRSDDRKRGYLDLPNSITVKVKTNLTSGVPVFLENSGGHAVLIREIGGAAYSDSGFTVKTDNFRPNSLISRSYDCRILLSADTKDGEYPLTISMAPAI